MAWEEGRRRQEATAKTPGARDYSSSHKGGSSGDGEKWVANKEANRISWWTGCRLLEKSEEPRMTSSFWPKLPEGYSCYFEPRWGLLRVDQVFEGKSDPQLDKIIYTSRSPAQKPLRTHYPFRVRAQIRTMVSKGSHSQALFSLTSLNSLIATGHLCPPQNSYAKT